MVSPTRRNSQRPVATVASLLSVLLWISLSTACSPSLPLPEPTPSPSPNGEETPAETPTLPAETQTPVLTPTQAPETPTPEPTPTLEPTATPPLDSFALEPCSDRKKNFWVWDTAVMPPRSVSVPATCRFIGPGSYIYVADDQWETYVSEQMAHEFAVAFEYRLERIAPVTTLEEDVGILDNDRAIFGELPDALDNDPRMYVLLVDIPDYVNDEGDVFRFDGYFNAYDQMTDEQAQRSTFGLYHSNEVEMLYLNARIRPVTDPYTLAVAAHELQHLIHYNYDTSEEIWMNEALAEVAMLVNGLFTDIGWVQRYASDPSIPLVTNTASGSYGAYLLWGMYLYEQVGPGFMFTLQEEQQDGISGLNRALKTVGRNTDFEALFLDWVVANYLQDPNLEDGRYGYTFTETLPMLASRAVMGPSLALYEDAVESFGAHYIEVVDVPSKSTLSVSSRDIDLLSAQLIRHTPKGVEVETLRGGGPNSLEISLEGGADYTYTLVVTNLDTRGIDSGEGVNYEVLWE